MKRKIWTLVALLMLVVLTAACIGGGTGGETGSGSGSQQPADTPAETGQDENGASDPTEVPKLTVWHIEVGEQKNALEQAIKRFEEEHQVEVEFVQHENDPYKTNLVVAMGAGNPPDVFHSWGGGWLKQFADAGQVLDLTEKIDPSQYVGAALSATTFDDRIYGVPMTLGIAPVFYNKEIFEQYNLTPPETYSELLEIVDTLNENGIIPFALANQTKWPGALYLIYFADRIAGHELFDSAFARTGRGFDDPAYVRAGEMIQELVQRNAFPEGFNGLNYDTGQARALLYSGKAAMMLMTSGFISNVRDEAPEFEEKLDIFNFPAVEGGEGDPSNVVGGVSPAFSVAASSKHPELAVELVKFLTSVEVAQEYTNITGKISAVQGVVSDDPFGQRFTEFLQQAGNMQTYYDQTLPPELGELHKDTTQALFGLDMTPEEAARLMEEKAKELLD